MRTCTQCGQTLDLAAFSFKDQATGRRRWDCKPCNRKYHRGYYARNKEYYKAKARDRHLRERDTLRGLVLEYLQVHPCVDCDESDVAVLEFDHSDPDHKHANVGDMLRRRYP